MIINTECLFDDTEGDLLLQMTEHLLDAPKLPTAKGYGVHSLSWLARVLPVLRTPGQLAAALMLYGECCQRRSCTVRLSNKTLQELGINRRTKYRMLRHLEEAGAATIETRNGRSTEVTLNWFP